MNWLVNIINELIARHPEGEILIESGGSPSGTYHLGHLRELVISDAILLELRRRGRLARHVYFVDDLDAFRKVPINVPASYEEHLGKPLCDIPAPDGTKQSYADYFLSQLQRSCEVLGIEVEFIKASEKYRSGFFVPAIERSLEHISDARKALETISGRKLDEKWTPIQILEKGRLKNRTYLGIDKSSKIVRYLDSSDHEQSVRYDTGEIKIDWRLDWPGRWWLLKVMAEPFGRDHATKGGSYDTGVQIMRDVYDAEPPLPVPYDFINMAGDTKKMSASRGTGLDAAEGSSIMPPEVVRYFILRSAPSKRLYFDSVKGVMQLMDEFAALAAKPDKTEAEEQLLYISTHGQEQRTVSSVPFSHLVASYQASLNDIDRTVEVIKRTEYAKVAEKDPDIIKNELKFIDNWLQKNAPEEVKFSLKKELVTDGLSVNQQQFLKELGKRIESAPDNADGTWFHQAIYDLKAESELEPQEMFVALYSLLIGKNSGPRAGWFLSILPRTWLVKRLKLES